MYLEEIVDNIQLENDRFECKAVLNRDDVVGGAENDSRICECFRW